MRGFDLSQRAINARYRERPHIAHVMIIALNTDTATHLVTAHGVDPSELGDNKDNAALHLAKHPATQPPSHPGGKVIPPI